MNSATIRKVAERFRHAIEALPKEHLPITFSNFPRGSCGDSCLLLGTYLQDECNVPGFMYISGQRGSHEDNTWTTHAWLSRGTTVVDITADQFEDAPEAIIVCENSVWHQTFQANRPQPSHISAWSGHGTFHVLSLYSRLKQELKRES